jgi:hypothetical protein
MGNEKSVESVLMEKVTFKFNDYSLIYMYMYVCVYRVIQEESAILWEMIVCVIQSKKVYMNMGPSLNGYGVMTA